MIVYRIASNKHSKDISGTGAAMYGGRWNKKGTPILYTGESKDIALLETVIHTPPMLVPNLDILTLEIPDDSISELKASDLPINWFDYPAPAILAELAEKWILENKTIALKVPSCVIHSSHNYLLNCRHPDFSSKVKILALKDFYFDSRLSF